MNAIPEMICYPNLLPLETTEANVDAFMRSLAGAADGSSMAVEATLTSRSCSGCCKCGSKCRAECTHPMARHKE